MSWQNLLGEMNQQVKSTFGQTVTYRRKGAPPLEIYEILAVFDIGYSLSEVGGKIGANIPEKTLDICLADIGGQPPKQGDGVLIDGTNYVVKDVKQSTSGMMKAVLREEK